MRLRQSAPGAWQPALYSLLTPKERKAVSPERRQLLSNVTGTAGKNEIQAQRDYYARTAQDYDGVHVRDDDEHGFALSFLIAAAGQLGIRSVLDVGCGTGRGLLRLKQAVPAIAAVGIEPSAELRAVGHAKGLSNAELIDGDAMNLAFADDSFDLACEFGALHHMPNPARAVAEMLRVSRRAIFISDSNNFGQGGPLSRFLKQSLNAIGLWPIADLIKTKGKGFTFDEGDGLYYSYSVFNDYKQIANACKSVHLLNTKPSGPNLYRTATHVALLGLKAAPGDASAPSIADSV